jgi:hypothetical protein
MRLAPGTMLAAVALALAAAGCSAGASKDDDAAEPAKRPKPETTVLVEQDFGAARPDGWIVGDRGRIAHGALVLRAGPGEVARSSSAKDVTIADAHVSVTGSSRTIKADNATFGVLCRWVFDGQGRSKDYYSFTIAPNGYAAIGTSQEILWQTRKDPAPAINRGSGAKNDIRAECIGDRLSLYVNDELVKTVTVDRIAGGDAGVLLENYAKRGAQVTATFDDFTLAQVG